MGSLPNLHELGKDDQGPHYRPGPALGHLCSGGQTVLTAEEKARVLHRHSGHCKITKARSNGHDSKIVYDDFMLEQMAAYSPVSSRSTRNLHSIRRRDSLSSSIGATSVRRLIAVVRNTSSRSGPVYSRRVLLRNLVVFCLTHLLITSALLPFLALQSSVSVWFLPIAQDILKISVNVGSALLTISYFFAAVSALFGPSLIQRAGTNSVFLVAYFVFCLFFASHLYPTFYSLFPVYIMLGLVLGPVSVARVTFLMTLSSKICYIYAEDDEDSKILRRTCIVRRVARAFKAAHDVGFILGSLTTAVLVMYHLDPAPISTYSNATICAENCSETNEFASFDDVFDSDEFGERLCGAQACPSAFQLSVNATGGGYFEMLPVLTGRVLAGVYATLAAIAFVVAASGLNRIRMYVYQDPLERSEGLAALRAVKESFRDLRLQLAAPLAVFIGLEQAFMYADFSKSYVVCTLGIHRLNLVFLCMGLLQSVAACTLSMLLRSIRRCYVIAVGFAFHACLLMVQIVWKPIGDDPALFYVISAAWGVCNAIWEMLNFTLLTGLYGDNWEPAFSNSFFFRFLGFSVAFGFHGLVCNYVKLYFLAFFMIFATVPLGYLEVKLENVRKVKNISRL